MKQPFNNSATRITASIHKIVSFLCISLDTNIYLMLIQINLQSNERILTLFLQIYYTSYPPKGATKHIQTLITYYVLY